MADYIITGIVALLVMSLSVYALVSGVNKDSD